MAIKTISVDIKFSTPTSRTTAKYSSKMLSSKNPIFDVVSGSAVELARLAVIEGFDEELLKVIQEKIATTKAFLKDMEERS